MNCNEVRERLLAWQYGELSAAEGAEVARHLDDCAACREQAAAWGEFRGLLGQRKTPAVQVDVPRVFAEASRRQDQRLRRWRRAAVAVFALAAAVLVAAVLKLEVRLESSQLVVGWGGRPEIPPVAAEPRIADSPAAVPTPVRQVNAEDVDLVKDLVRVLAEEVEARDRRHQEDLLRLQARYETLLGGALERWAGNERDVAALYAAHFRIPSKGGKP